VTAAGNLQAHGARAPSPALARTALCRRWWPYHLQPASPVPIRSPEAYKAEIAAPPQRGDKAKLKKILQAREEEKARTLAAVVRVAR
jgi:hypothetical protein